jgi:predicted ATPase
MRLATVYARFFRSLNYDYLRMSHPDYQPDPWDATPSGLAYPFVRVRLEEDITTVVGANESGKSQLLDAIKCGLTGEGIERGDFCRYSPFFSTDSTLILPEFGLGFRDVSDEDRSAIAAACELDEVPNASRAELFRVNETPQLRLYIHDGAAWTMHAVTESAALKQFGLPGFFEIDSKVPLPDAVPIEFLATGDVSTATGRDSHRQRWDKIMEKGKDWFASRETLQSSADEVVATFADVTAIDDETRKKYELADDLLVKVAGLDRELFNEIRRAVSEGRNGYAGGIVETINKELAKGLNFPHWWSQDSFFELFVDLRDYDLVFMIRDRTGMSYSFDERSAGLKYFLSYFVQYLSHEPPQDGQPEILLMDEPDAFLSSSGQQDLLRIFSAFAHPDEADVRPVQVVYVTHSPFLIDKNHAERIRVLEKGEHDEGTRVVANASRNHYEPLRSAFGSFVGETTFIGNCNLLLEGASDQILIAGISSWLGKRNTSITQRLDLNTITLVPAGSASHVPYLAFLARGRDVDRPAVIVLLDDDPEGDRAKAVLARGGPREKQLVAPEYILQLGDSTFDAIETSNPAGRVGIEDLIPLEIAVAAAKRYGAEFVSGADMTAFAPAAEAVYAGGKDTHDGLESVLRAHLNDAEFDLDKIGFARSILASLADGGDSDAALSVLEANFKVLLGRLAKLQRGADREAGAEKIRSRVNRVRRRFATDHPHSARREDVLLFIEEVEGQLDSAMEAEETRATLRRWAGELKIEEDPRAEVEDYPAFLRKLEGLAYAGSLSVQEPELAD